MFHFFYRAENPNHYTESHGRWFTSRIINRIEENLVETKGGPYRLEGNLHTKTAKEYNTPQFIMDFFRKGFPERWDMYRDEWRTLIKQQRGT